MDRTGDGRTAKPHQLPTACRNGRRLGAWKERYLHNVKVLVLNYLQKTADAEHDIDTIIERRLIKSKFSPEVKLIDTVQNWGLCYDEVASTLGEGVLVSTIERSLVL